MIYKEDALREAEAVVASDSDVAGVADSPTHPPKEAKDVAGGRVARALSAMS